MKKFYKVLFALFVSAVLMFGLAACTKKDSNSRHTVTFNTYGGSEIAAVQVEDGELLEKPADPVKKGYVFGHWNYDFAEFDFNTPITSDMTLDAIWTAATDTPYTVKVFIMENGTYQDKTSQFSEIIGETKGTTDTKVSVFDKVNPILETLEGYYFDSSNENCVYEGVIAGDGSTVFSLYFAELVVPEEILVGYSTAVSVYTHDYTCDTQVEVLVNSEEQREGDVSLLKLTAKNQNRRFMIGLTPEHQDWSEYDYVGFWVYNGTNTELYARNGLMRTEGSPDGSYALARNAWTFVAIDLSEHKVGDFKKVYETNAVEKFAVELERNNTNADISEGSYVYVSNIRGYNFESKADTENLVLRFDEPTSCYNNIIWTEREAAYHRYYFEKVKIGEETVAMTKFEILQQATEEALQGILMIDVKNDHPLYGSYSFEFYNPNSFAVMVGSTKVDAGAKVNITVLFDDSSMFDSYNRMKLVVKTEDGNFLPAGSAYYIGNIYGNVQKFTVTFDSGEEAMPVEPVQVNKGSAVAEPAAPVREGYDFVCWNLNGSKYSFDTPVTGNITLVAVWQAKGNVAYTVKVFVQENGEYIEKSGEFEDILFGLSGAADSQINVQDKADIIAERLGYRYYFDADQPGCSVEGTIAPDGSTVLSLYYTVDTAVENVVAAFTGEISPFEHQFTCSMNIEVLKESEFIREGDLSVLKVTATSQNRRFLFDVVPEYQNWSEYDYVGFWVYNGTGVDVFSRSGLMRGNANTSRPLYMNEWTFFPLDITKYPVGSVGTTYEKNAVEKFGIEIEFNNAGAQIPVDGYIYVSNIRGYFFPEDSNEQNLVVRFGDPTGVGSNMIWTEREVPFHHYVFEEVMIGEESFAMTKFEIIQQASEEAFQGVLMIDVLNTNSRFTGYTFELYNPNDFSVKVGNTVIEPKTKSDVIINYTDSDMFDSDNRMKIIVKTEDGNFLPAGSAYYLGNIYGIPKA